MEEIITNRKSIPKPFIVGIVIVILIALSIFSYISFKDRLFSNQNDKTASQDGWQLHASPENSYSFSYPDNASIRTRPDGAIDVEFSESESSGSEGDFPPGYVLNIEEVSLDGKTLKEIADEAYNTPLTAPDEKSIEEIELNGFKGYKVVRKIQTASTYIFLDENNGKYLSIYHNVYDKNGKGYDETVSQIINSFILSQ